ncbi:MAG: hypothetical protein OEM28_01310 [Nitrosopumilus sp.]|nr:hypothetical protein [Nitrosopumilus sp.]MDH3486505.1 hypothetical protein [Nitrosopumilus sp.]
MDKVMKSAIVRQSDLLSISDFIRKKKLSKIITFDKKSSSSS